MTQRPNLLSRPRLAMLLSSALLIGGAHALTKEEYDAQKDQIKASYQADKERCDSLSGTAKDVCQAEAQGKEKVAHAQLDARHEPGPKAEHDLAKAQADAAYDVAKTQCGAQEGNAKDVCEKDAKAEQVRAIETARLHYTEASSEATGDAREAELSKVRLQGEEAVRKAEYEAAKERCDDLSGDAKKTCGNDAKAQFAQ
ncbi:hypothetical protein [Corticibacter populi]|nr:hypothetical protein [Corticibacter populi]RZS33662.1 hypothetical protein EV687_1988 [Corticibacter populi]